MRHLTKKKWFLTNAGLLVLLAATCAAAVTLGPEHVAWRGVWDGTDARATAIVMVSRLPRVLIAMLIGMALASAGSVYQAMLKNPLADPFILGVAGGAALGGVIATAIGAPTVLISVAAFIGAASSILLIFAIARTHGRLPAHTLLLTGVVFNAFCFALILFVNAVVNMEEAYQILFLLIGNVEVSDLTTVAITAAFILPMFVLLVVVAGRMNVLTLGDDEAHALGLHVERLRALVFIASSVMVGAAVAVSGLVGFVGLFIPHAVRLVFGADHRLLVPASGLMGAMFLVAADTAARTLLVQTQLSTQLPVGVITALIGAPAFMILLRRQMRETSQ